MSSKEPVVEPPDLREMLGVRFRGPLMSFFMRRLNDRAESEDLTQETLLRVLRSHGLQGIQNPESYIFKVAVNLLRDHRKQAGRFDPASCMPVEEAVVSENEPQLVEDLSPERVLISKDSLKEALKALGELDERTRDIFILFRLEHMKQKDIAALYGMAQSTVEKRIMRAVQHLTARQGGIERT